MRCLGVESSCDETGVALYDAEHGLLAHGLHSQIEIHARYGGVVPEIASRDHVRRMIPLLEQVLSDADCTLDSVTGVAYTAGPGLAGALLVGATFARALAYARGLPAIGVHHLEGHLLAPMLEPDPPAYPFLALLVSGGHTLLAEVGGVGRYRVLGESLDDAAGEAFDKTASLLGLSYPGGPALARLAEHGDPERFHFPRPMTNRPGLDFSFSGLKTHAAVTFRSIVHDDASRADVARAFEEAVIDTLAIKCRRALAATGLSRLVVAGGVAANQRLRTTLAVLGEKHQASVYYPRPALCTDNGAMIAYAGCQRLVAGERGALGFTVHPRWSLSDLAPPASDPG